MTPKSVARRGGIATVAAGSALALAACGAGQISQTANQVAAVDGAANTQAAVPGGVAVRDAHVVVYPDGTAGVKFSVANEERGGDEYTLVSVEVEGAGEVDLSPVAQTPTAERLSDDALTIPRDCSIVADADRQVAELADTAEGNPACISYVGTTVDAGSLAGAETSAAGGNRLITFVFTSDKGGTERIELHGTVSAFIPEAGVLDREHGTVAPEAPAARKTPVTDAEGASDPDADAVTGADTATAVGQ